MNHIMQLNNIEIDGVKYSCEFPIIGIDMLVEHKSFYLKIDDLIANGYLKELGTTNKN